MHPRPGRRSRCLNRHDCGSAKPGKDPSVRGEAGKSLLCRHCCLRATPNVLLVCCPRACWLRLHRQPNILICGYFPKTGATGLEPATSGVTGRVGHNDVRRRTALNVLICRRFSCGGWLRSGWLSQSSDRRLGHEWATKSCLYRQRSDRWGASSRPPPYLFGGPATGRNPWQRFWLVRAVFGAIPFATGCHRLRPLCSINAPCLGVHEGNTRRGLG
jgi:hypothetical protein